MKNCAKGFRWRRPALLLAVIIIGLTAGHGMPEKLLAAEESKPAATETEASTPAAAETEASTPAAAEAEASKPAAAEAEASTPVQTTRKVSLRFSEDWSGCVEADGVRTAYYGLTNGTGKPKAAIITFIAEGTGGRTGSLPSVLVKKGNRIYEFPPGKTGSGPGFLSCVPWKAQGNSYVLELTIRPEAENSEADGEYTFALRSFGRREEEDFVWADPKDPYDKVVIDTVRPVAEYSVDQKAHAYAEADYYKESFTERFTVTEKNFAEERMKAIFWKTAALDESDTTGLHKGPDERDGGRGIYTYRRTGRDEAVYRAELSGTDLAGNRLRFIEGTNLSETDRAAIAAANGSAGNAGSGVLRTTKKVLDNTPPRVTCTATWLPDTHIYKEERQNAAYYNKDFRLTFTVEEEHYDAGRIDRFYARVDGRIDAGWETVSGKRVMHEGRAVLREPPATEPKDGKYVYTASVKALAGGRNDGRYMFTISGTDKAGNGLWVAEGADMTKADPAQTKAQKLAGTYSTGVKVLDTVAPAVTYDVTELEASHSYVGDADYFNKDLTVSFSVLETNFDPAKERMSLSVISSEAAETARVKISGPKAEPGAVYRYTGSVKAEADGRNDGRYAFVFRGEDKAGNKMLVRMGGPVTENDREPTEQEMRSGIFKTGVKVMDTTAPVFTLTELTKPVNADENVDGLRAYYGGTAIGRNLRFSFRVDDVNLDGKKVAGDFAYKNGDRYADTDPVWEDPFGKDPGPSKGSRERQGTVFRAKSVPIVNGKDGAYRAVLAGEDMAGNRLVMSKEEERRNRSARAFERTEAYAADGQFRSMIKIIDTIAPAGNLKLRNPKKLVYYDAELRKDTGLSVKASEPYRGETSAEGTVTVYGSRDGHSEHSPVKIDYSVVSSVNGLSRNESLGYAYAGAADFLLEDQQVFYLKLKLTDRAGNTTGLLETNKIYLDVQNPAIPEDRLAPSISISAKARSGRHGPTGNPLYNGSVPFRILVAEPNRPADGSFSGSRSAGLGEVYYTISVDGREGSPTYLREMGSRRFGGEADGRTAYRDPELVYELEAAETVDGKLNHNDLALTVYAKDNAGNTRYVSYRFGIDISPPVIRVTYDHNDVRGGRYFREDRTATIVVTERNFDGSRIKILADGGRASEWVCERHGGNGDSDTWTKTVTFSRDGDYSFDVSGTDLLGNAAENVRIEGAAAKHFTVDKTPPVIRLQFDRNDGREGRYYGRTRKADITVKEKHLRLSDIRVGGLKGLDPGSGPAERTEEERERTLAAADGEGDSYVPGEAAAGLWTVSGELCHLEVTFAEDGDYQLVLSASDLAGNRADTVISERFTIDKTRPSLSFDPETVKERTAYGGLFEPGILYSDANFDPEGVVFTMRGNRGTVFDSPVHVTEAFGGSSRFPNLEEQKKYDDIYTLWATVTDRAGNVSEERLVCSVNRFGSTWMYADDGTETAVRAHYIREEREVCLCEINVTKTSLRSVSLRHEGSYRTLTEGEDFETVDQFEEGRWRSRTYRFFAGNFSEEGSYSLVVHTVDETGNENCNTGERQDDGRTAVTPLEFTVDKTGPYAMLENLDASVKEYRQEALVVELTPEDNLSGIVRVRAELERHSGRVCVFDKENRHRDPETGLYTDELREFLDAHDGHVVFEIPGDGEPQTVRVTCWDGAGNVSGPAGTGASPEEEGEALLENILVTTNVASRVFYNRPLFVLLLVSGFAMAGGLVLAGKRRKASSLRGTSGKKQQT